MKTKTWLMALPVLCMAAVAMAQGAAEDEAQVQSEAQAREEARAREEAQVEDTAPVQVQEQKPSTRKRQGADMRHCLDKQDPKEISRCAEPGRKP
jgi:hemolysin activation/secretion protein